MKTIVGALLLFMWVVLPSGCADSYQVKSLQEPVAVIPSNSLFYVVLPTNGQYEHIKYTTSGMMTQGEIASELSKNGAKVVLAGREEERSAPNSKAKRHRFPIFCQYSALGRSGN